MCNKKKPLLNNLTVLKVLSLICFLFATSLFSQEWASMTYIVNKNDPIFFRGSFNSESKEDIVSGKDCIDDKCVYEMTLSKYVIDMELLGWEVSEQINTKDKKGLNVIWFRRYQ